MVTINQVRTGQSPTQALPGIRVKLLNEDYLATLKHPTTKRGFRSLEDSVEWPNDSFTQRRINDGDVAVVEDPARTAEERRTREVAFSDELKARVAAAASDTSAPEPPDRQGQVTRETRATERKPMVHKPPETA